MVNAPFADRHIPLFSIPDYVVFALMLLICTGIGVYHAFAKGGQKTTRQFLLADRQMQILPVAMSLLASFMSAITVLGTPAETYKYGTMYLMFMLSYLLMGMAAAHIYMPVFFNLGITSAYEYLQRRFSGGVRRMGSAIFMLQMIMYMGIVLYAPSLALEAVTGMNVWAAVLSLGIICTFYTTIGGMKAVLWTDTFQVCVMIAGFLAVIIQGSINLGGFNHIWETAYNGSRLEFYNFDPDPRIRHSSWSVHVGGTFMWLAIFGVNQAQVQRYLTVNNLKKAQIALYLNVIGLWLIVILATLCGLVLYAFYKDCDPIVAGYISTSDQLMPLIVMEILSHLKGMPGVFVSCVFAGALSTMSSGLNSLSAVTLEDFVRPVKKDLTERQYTLISKLLVALFGGLMMLMAYVSSFMGGVLQAALSIFGMIGGPLLGLFSLGILFPWANVWGAYAGTITGFVLVFWVGIGAQVYKPPVFKPPISTAGCPLANVTTTAMANMTTMAMTTFTGTTMEPVTLGGYRPVSYEGLSDLHKYWYSISYLYYSVIAVLAVLIIGLIVSFATGAQDPKELDPRLITPFFDTVCCCFPGRWREKLRCNVRHDEAELFAERELREKEEVQDQEDDVELKDVGRDSQKRLLRRKVPWDSGDSGRVQEEGGGRKEGC